jgi:hypothetical protein
MVLKANFQKVILIAETHIRMLLKEGKGDEKTDKMAVSKFNQITKAKYRPITGQLKTN